MHSQAFYAHWVGLQKMTNSDAIKCGTAEEQWALAYTAGRGWKGPGLAQNLYNLGTFFIKEYGIR